MHLYTNTFARFCPIPLIPLPLLHDIDFFSFLPPGCGEQSGSGRMSGQLWHHGGRGFRPRSQIWNIASVSRVKFTSRHDIPKVLSSWGSHQHHRLSCAPRLRRWAVAVEMPGLEDLLWWRRWQARRSLHAMCLQCCPTLISRPVDWPSHSATACHLPTLAQPRLWAALVPSQECPPLWRPLTVWSTLPWAQPVWMLRATVLRASPQTPAWQQNPRTSVRCWMSHVGRHVAYPSNTRCANASCWELAAFILGQPKRQSCRQWSATAAHP